jgi:hypothetical protein
MNSASAPASVGISIRPSAQPTQTRSRTPSAVYYRVEAMGSKGAKIRAPEPRSDRLATHM